MHEWVLGLDSWIIQDGNYGDFRRGDRVELAVEFHLREAERCPPATPAATPKHDAEYEIVARVTYAASEAWVIDCGILVYDDDTPPPAGVNEGDWITGRAFLGVDPFMYFERLHGLPGIPALVHSWHIEHIRRQTAPFVETSPLLLERDATRLGWVDIEKTDAWDDDDGHAEYLLDCRLLNIPAKRRSATAT